jgi:hypothetical protein
MKDMFIDHSKGEVSEALNITKERAKQIRKIVLDRNSIAGTSTEIMEYFLITFRKDEEILYATYAFGDLMGMASMKKMLIGIMEKYLSHAEVRRRVIKLITLFKMNKDTEEVGLAGTPEELRDVGAIE